MMTSYVSIIIPVYNETAAINQTMGGLVNDLQGIPCEAIVVDGNPKGNTIATLAPFFRSKTIDLKRIISKKSGRAVQMNAGAGLARGSLLLFLHADTRLTKAAAGRVLRLLDDPGPARCGAFSLGIRHPGSPYRLIETMANLRSSITRLPYGDQAQFFLKGFFDKLGGYADIPIMEDVEIMQRVKGKKERCRIFPEKVFTSARRWEKEGLVFCTLRNWMLISLYSMGMSPSRLARYYRRHDP